MPATYKVRIAPVPKGVFSTTATYKTNDIVRYEGASYIFTADKQAGAWDAAKAQLICQDGILPTGSVADGGTSADL